MIELGRLNIYHQPSIIEARTKIWTVALKIGCSDILCTRLATVLSEIFRTILKDAGELHVLCFLLKHNNANALIFEIHSSHKGNLAPMGRRFFHLFHYERTENGQSKILARLNLDSQPLDISEQMTDEIRNVIGEHSRDELMKEMAAAKVIAEDAAMTKANFLANMSHEIRTPMNAILGMTYLIKKTAMTEKQKDYIDKIYQSSQHLLGIIDDVLDFSKIEAGKMSIEETAFNLKDVFKNITNLIEEKCQAKGLELIFDMDPKIPDELIGDPLRLSQILVNYSSNAVKFTNQGKITVRVYPLSIEENECVLRFEVEDTGIGLRREQMNKLFQSFQQADTSTTRKFGGTGLGLAISKNLAELMQGEAGVESQFGKGSIFWFTAKLHINHMETDGTKVQSRKTDLKGIYGADILLVEDNELNIQLAVEILQERGFKIVAARNGEIAVNLAKEKHYDLILMDMQMPVMDGIEATRAIRKMDHLRNIPIIAMTANAMWEDIKKCLAAGMNDHIAKPINPEKLFAMLVKYIPSKNTGELSIRTAQQGNHDDHKQMPNLDIEGLNTEAGLKHVLGKQTLYISLLNTFIEDQRDTFINLQNLLENGRYKEAEILIHTLKGVAGTLGAEEIYERAARLELSIREGAEKETLEPLIDETRTQLNHLIHQLEGVLPKETKQNNQERGPSASQAELLQLLDEIKPHIELSKPKQCARILEKLRKLEWPVPAKDIFKEFDRLISKYKYKEALSIYDNLKKVVLGA